MGGAECKTSVWCIPNRWLYMCFGARSIGWVLLVFCPSSSWRQAPHPRFWSFFSDPGPSEDLMLCFSGFSGFQPGNSSVVESCIRFISRHGQDYSLVILRQSWEELPGILCRVRTEVDFPSWRSQKRNKILFVHIRFATSEWPHLNTEWNVSCF